MNPILILWALIGAFIIWLLASFLYRPIGRLFARLFNDAKREMFETNDEKENKNE